MVSVESCSLYESAFKDLNEAVFVVDQEKTVWCNQEALDLLGLGSLEEFVGQPVGFRLQDYTYEETSERLETILANGTKTEGIMKLRKTDGSLITCAVRSSVIEAASGVYSVSLVRELDEDESQERLVEFLDIVKHEVNTPLSVIWGYSEIIMQKFGDELPSEVLVYLNRMTDNLKRLESMNKALLKLANLTKR